jgi:hypothetical protein
MSQISECEVKEAAKQIPFMKLENGKNFMRIVSFPAKFFQVIVKLPLSNNEFGNIIRSYTPGPIEELCNKRPSERYYMFVIDGRDNKLKLLVASSVIMDQIHGAMQEKNIGNDKKLTPFDFDININFNIKNDPTRFYMVEACETKALSADDLEIINTLGDEMMLKILKHLTQVPTRETFVKNLEKLGWCPENKQQAAVEKAVAEKAVAEKAVAETNTPDDSLLSAFIFGLPLMSGCELLSALLNKKRVKANIKKTNRDVEPADERVCTNVLTNKKAGLK